MFSHLGAKLDSNFEDCNSFAHPTTCEKVYVLLDVVHMIKLLRNLFGESKVLKLDGKELKWSYIQVSLTPILSFTLTKKCLISKMVLIYMMTLTQNAN